MFNNIPTQTYNLTNEFFLFEWNVISIIFFLINELHWSRNQNGWKPTTINTKKLKKDINHFGGSKDQTSPISLAKVDPTILRET